MNKYQILETIGDGTFGIVYKAICISTKEVVAIKRLKNKVSSWEEILSEREIKVLTKLNHQNIVRLYEVIQTSTKEVNMVFEYVGKNLYEYLTEEIKTSQLGILPDEKIRNIIYQILQGLYKIHDEGLMHRDIKPENILIKNDYIVKIADFGLAKEVFNYKLNTNPAVSSNVNTEYVATRWYRAPEIILKSKTYSSAIDVFSLGCIFAELLNNQPLFPGRNEIDQLNKYCEILKSPSQSEWQEGYLLANKIGYKFNQSYNKSNLHLVIPRANGLLLDLIEKMLSINPSNRLSVKECLTHPYFQVHNNILSFYMPQTDEVSEEDDDNMLELDDDNGNDESKKDMVSRESKENKQNKHIYISNNINTNSNSNENNCIYSNSVVNSHMIDIYYNTINSKSIKDNKIQKKTSFTKVIHDKFDKPAMFELFKKGKVSSREKESHKNEKEKGVKEGKEKEKEKLKLQISLIKDEIYRKVKNKSSNTTNSFKKINNNGYLLGNNSKIKNSFVNSIGMNIKSIFKGSFSDNTTEGNIIIN